jgi:hypothetical protein
MTHTMIPGPITSWSKSLLRCKSKLKVMDAVAADRTGLMKKEERWALQGHAQVDPALDTPCLGPVGLET